MVNVTLNTKSRSCIASSIFLGYEGENQANKLVFSFDDEFVDGSAQLNIKRGNDNGYVALIKVGETYELEVKSSLVSKIGDVTFQLQVSKSDGTIYKFDTFIMTVKDAIDSDIPLPEDYPNWQQAISTALAEMDNINISIDKVDTTTTVSVTDKKGVITEVEIHDGADGKDGKDGVDGANGKDGKDGFSPIATVTQTDTGATISITDTNGTTIATVKNGKDGSSGILEETDPVYLADKPNIALKSELPTKLSQLQNDSEFITKTVNNLTNYYAKTETYTKTEINNLIGGLGSLDLEIVQSLPTVGKENTFYLLAQNREAPDIYDEYLYINGWEKIGSTAVDLTNYYTKSEVDNLIPTVPTKISELENDSGYLKEYTETDPTIPTHVKNITQENITNWNNKSEFSGSYNDLTDKPTIPSVEGFATTEQLTQGLATKQDKLTAGDNITIENGVISSTGGGSGQKKAILSKDNLQLGPSQNFDMDIKYNGGFKVNNGRIVLEKGKKYYISIQACYFVGSTNDSQFSYHANAGDEVTILYATTWSNTRAGADGTGCDVFEPTEDTELTFQTESWSSSVTSVEVRCVVEELGTGSSSSEQNYSLEEQRIGTWIDGKPLYRKVYKFDIVTSSTRQNIIFDESFGTNKVIKKISGNVFNNDYKGFQYPIGLFSWHNSTNQFFVFMPCVDNGGLKLEVQWSAAQNFTVEAIVEYTKLTD